MFSDVVLYVMFDEDTIALSPYEIQKGDYVYFRIPKWLAIRKGLCSITGHKNDCIDQGMVTWATPKSVGFAYLKLHDKRDIWLPKSEFIWVKKARERKLVDWEKKLEETKK
ncbi:MAG: hypothetical protein ACTSP3_05860 [Candidatus Heimdallarchaeaceae archaeon]